MLVRLVQSIHVSTYPPMEEYNDNKDFLPCENVRKFREEVSRLMTDQLILEWAELFSNNPFLLESTYSVPERLFAKIE